MSRLTLLFLLLIPTVAGSAPLPTAKELLERSIAYHDPRDAWSSRPIEIVAEVRLAKKLAEARGYASRIDRIVVDNMTGRFRYESDKGEDRIEIIVDGDEFSARLNGESEIAPEDQEHHRLAPENLPGWRDYMVYMYGLPMKLRDPGTRLDPTVERAELDGMEVLALKVTYSPEVGADIWYFYFNPETFALVGCRFFHDESKQDGEYLVFKEEVQGPDNLRLPKLRRWHMNIDDMYIAVDDIRAIK